jgi:hypothetical protein
LTETSDDSARSSWTLLSHADWVLNAGSTALMLCRDSVKPGGGEARLAGNAGAPVAVGSSGPML